MNVTFLFADGTNYDLSR